MTGSADSVGSVEQETAKLIDALHDWARRTFGEGDAARMSTGAAECEWCPLCQMVSVLRGDRPETTEKILAAGSALMSALRNVSDAIPTPDAGGAATASAGQTASQMASAATAAANAAANAVAALGLGNGFGNGAAGTHRADGPRVQRIDLGQD